MKRVVNTKSRNSFGGFTYRMIRILADGRRYGYEVMSHKSDPRGGVADRLLRARFELRRAVEAARSMNRSE